MSSDISAEALSQPQAGVLPRRLILFDVSDLVFYVGHHDTLTGIQRVQAEFVLSIAAFDTPHDVDIVFITWNRHVGYFEKIDSAFLYDLLYQFGQPAQTRSIIFDHESAKLGFLPGNTGFDPALNRYAVADIVLIGAAWVMQDYFHSIGVLKRRLQASFYATVHDLIPIYARDTCDQGTAIVFSQYMLNSIGSVDAYICVSANTERDLQRYLQHVNAPVAPSTVIRSGWTPQTPRAPAPSRRERGNFVLFVSTIEGRKNHILAFKTWERLVKRYADPPRLVCVGRYGWRSEEFLRLVTMSRSLNGKIEIRAEIADDELEDLYAACLFTIYPSLYEGWGLPISESLARGKVCICSSTSSMPEAGGELAVYIDPNGADDLFNAVTAFLEEPGKLAFAEERIANGFVPRPWRSVYNDYLDFVRSRQPSEPAARYVAIELGREYPLREVPVGYEDEIGPKLIALIRSRYKASFVRTPYQTFDFIEGQNLRDMGDWKAPERWGTWLGLRGGDIAFWWGGEPTDVACLMHVIMAPGIDDKEVQYRLNGALVRKRIPGNGTRKFHQVQLTLQSGVNWLHVEAIDPASLPAKLQTDDQRGLMWGIGSILVVALADVSAQLDALELFFEEP